MITEELLQLNAADITYHCPDELPLLPCLDEGVHTLLHGEEGADVIHLVSEIHLPKKKNHEEKKSHY